MKLISFTTQGENKIFYFQKKGRIEKMATIREIQTLLDKVNITIDKNDVKDSIGTLEVGEKLEEARTVEEFLLKNAQYVNFKKLLIIVVKRLQELYDGYKEKNISRLLEENSKNELDKAIKLAKSYIKPNENIMTEAWDYAKEPEEYSLFNSRVIIYGQNIEKNKEYEKIKDLLPDIDAVQSIDMLTCIINDVNVARSIFDIQMQRVLQEEGYTAEEQEEFLKRLAYANSDNELQQIFKEIDQKQFTKYIKESLDKISPYLDAKRLIFYHAFQLKLELENSTELDDKSIKFLNHLEELSKDLNKNEGIKFVQGYYGKEDIDKFLLRWDKEKGEYCADEQLYSGKKLLKDMNGYEDYCTKEELRNLAKVEENLVYLAQSKKLNNSTIYNIAMNNQISEKTLIELYICGALDLRKVEKCASKNGINIDDVKDKIKKEKLENNEKIDLNNEDTWNLLNEDERLQMVADFVDSKNEEMLQERIKEVYDINKIANLYKKIHINKNEEGNQEQDKKEYQNLIKLHNALGLENNDDIITLLEDELSNEMLVNLYNDNVISLDVLESYGEAELVIEVFNQGKIHEKDLRKTIIRYPIPLEEQKVCEWYDNGVLQIKDIVELYVNDRINLDLVKRINENLPEDEKIDSYLAENELAKLYQSAKKDVNSISKYKRFRLLYQTFKREKSDKKILENLSNITKEDLMQLYKDNLLTLETILEEGGDELVKHLVEKGELKPSDAKVYYQSENTNIEEILKNPDMDDTEKMILIYSTYDDNKEQREYLVNYLQTHVTDAKEESSIQRDNINSKNNVETKKTVTDPYERWRLFTLLDHNYTKKYVDGYLIVNLNNSQKTIVEKMYQKRNGKVVSAYGTATFILDTEEYEKMEDELVDGKRFKVAKLRKLTKENPENYTKITHHPPLLDEDGNEKTSWGKRLLGNIGKGEIEKIYSAEEMKEIQECMRDIEKSRQELEI